MKTMKIKERKITNNNRYSYNLLYYDLWDIKYMN